MKTLTAKALAQALHHELEADGWGDIDPWWIKEIADGDDPEHDEQEEIRALYVAFAKAAQKLNARK